MDHLHEMEQLRRQSERVWLYTSAKTTKAAIDSLYGVIVGLRRALEYPADERAARAYVVLCGTSVAEMMRAFRCPRVAAAEQDAARANAMHLREQFRAALRRFVSSLRVDDIPPETIAALRLDGPERIARYLDTVRQQVDDAGLC